MSSTPVKKAAREATESKPLRALARTGFAVNGLMHAVIGLVAIRIATGSGGEADQSGAFAQIAKAPGGPVILWTIVIGMVALGVWLILEAFLIPGADPKRKWAHRIGGIAKGLVYLALGVTAFSFARGGSTNSVSTSKTFSATLLSAPGGVILLLVLGLAIVAVGGYFLVKGATRKFRQDIRVLSGAAGKAIVVLGVVGYIAKGVALCMVGLLIVIGALAAKPSESKGLDGALRTFAALPFGSWILSAIGVGLIAYGLYSFARARLVRL
ncbi:MAG: rane protein [Microbacteriaceae bacterium]|jgi:hypothetical protein|nr:rane protein [Microbacteriaceae bacterium]